MAKESTFEEKMDKKMDKLKIMDKSNGQIGNNGQIMDKNDLKWILNGLNGNHTLAFCNPQNVSSNLSYSKCASRKNA